MVKRFPDQLQEAIEIGTASNITKLLIHPNLVFVAGMGGSGIGADFVASFFKNELKIPYIVGKSYDPPAFVDSTALVIASSYSGNTEETISCLNTLENRVNSIKCISSGGEIKKMALAKSYDFIQLPTGWTSPRACLGYSVVAQMFILKKLQLLSLEFETSLKNTIQRLSLGQQVIMQDARRLADHLNGKRIIIYSSDLLEPVAIRFRQQINENTKRLCSHHVIPEMNHNELVGWRQQDPNIAVLFLRSGDDHPRVRLRTDLCKEIISHYAGSVFEIYGKGADLIEKSFYLVHLLDFVSVYLALDYNIDPVEVKVIDFLKSELSKTV